MALSVETGQFAANTGSATTTVSHSFGTTPLAIIMWTTGQTTTGSDSAANASFSFGFSDATNFRSIGWASDDNVGTTNCGKAFRTDRIVEVFSNGTPTTVRYVNDWNPTTTNFDVVWDGTPAAAYLVSYIIIGGTDVTNVIVGTHTLDTATGSDSVTGLAFQPDFGVFINAQATAAGTAVRALGSIGFAASSSKEFTMAWGIDDGATMTATIDAVSYTNQAACMSGITAGAETVDFLADFTSFNSDGYTINISNAPPAAWLVGYLLIKGGQWDVGTTTHASARTLSGMAFQPKGIAFSFGRTTTDATVTVDQQVGFGAAASTTTEVVGMAGQLDATLNTDVERYTNTGNLYWRLGSSNTWVLDSFNSDGATLSGAGSSGNQVGWFAMGDNAAPPSTLVKDIIMPGITPFAR